MSLQVTVQPSAEPFSVQDIRDMLRLTLTDDDVLIAGHIKSARRLAETITHRSMTPKTYLYSMDRFPAPGTPIRMPAPPLIAVASIKYLDSALTQQTWDPAEYFVAQKQSPALIIPKPG